MTDFTATLLHADTWYSVLLLTKGCSEQEGLPIATEKVPHATCSVQWEALCVQRNDPLKGVT